MKLGKINFFKRVYLAITDFRMYPYAQKEKFTIAIGYFIKLLILASFIIGTIVTSNIFKESPNVLNMFEKHMPDFKLTDGKLEVIENVEKEINNDLYLVVNSDCSSKNINELIVKEEETHNYYILVVSDATLVGVRLEDGIHELGRIIYEPTMNITKKQFVEEWGRFNMSAIMKVTMWISTSIAILIGLIIIRMWTIVMYLISAYIINFMFGLRLKLIEYLKIVIYTSTLPIILELIALIIVGFVSETVNFISVLVSSVYIFYALRAIKLDTLILGGNGKTAEEKLKNALSHAQEELEKQLQEIEKKEKSSEEEKNDEKRKLDELRKELKEKEENLIKAQKEYDEVIKKAMEIDTKEESDKGNDNNN